MNKYVRKLFGVVFQGQQTPQIVRGHAQHSPTSPEEWRQHWQSQGQPWRTEPEIDAKRQEELSKRRAIVPDIEKGIYPFKGMKLSRADIEWLLATHENGRGPVDWSSERDLYERRGIDLRGADLRGVDLSGLPLTRMQGGLTLKESREATDEQRRLAAVDLQEAILYTAQLQGATLTFAQLQHADLRHAQLQHTNLYGARLPNADLRKTDLDHATLDYVTFSDPVDGCTCFADINWGEVNLALVDWKPVTRLGDERVARQEQEHPGTSFPTIREDQYREAVRANRQLAIILRDQGLNEEADRFAYRAQVLQRKVLWKQGAFGKWLFSLFLALLTGYGYRMWRILVAYLIVVSACAVAYFVLSIFYGPQMSPLDAVLTSITAFHGRVFSEPFQHSPQLWVTAFEAIAGLVLEGVFIAMLTQKFFGK